MALLEIHSLYTTFGKGSDAVPAVRGVDLDVHEGETVGLVGESGCGKTTLGRVVVGLQHPTSGQVVFDGENLTTRIGDREFRRRLQMVFQHPQQSLNAKFRVETMLREPLHLLGRSNRSTWDEQIDEVLKLVGLGPEFRRRRPSELSGGQQQRVAIARALMSEPDFVVLDEPTSSLDQSVRGRIVSLFREIQERRRVAYLFISHDLSTVRRIAARVAVMYLGRIVEVANMNRLFESPQHPYTVALLSAVPSVDPKGRKKRIVLAGETPSPSSLPFGCSFQDRCPLVHDRCRAESPQLESLSANHEVECFAVTSHARVESG